MSEKRETMLDKLKKWGSRRKCPSPKEALEYMLHKKNMNLTEIGREMGCAPSTVLYWIKELEVEYEYFARRGPDSIFIKKIKEKGYDDLEAFFSDPEIIKLSFVEIGDMLGVHRVTVSKWYKRFEEELTK